MNIVISVTTAADTIYIDDIREAVYKSALERGTGIAVRSYDYLKEKIEAGKAVIALDGKELAAFAYIETWSHSRFVANSGLIVLHKYRDKGLARKVKKRIFDLSRKLYPNAKIFSITTGLAVMKLNTELGFKPVPYSELTDDPQFWKGCEGCINYDILQRNNYKMCLCTGLLYDPAASKKSLLPTILVSAGKSLVLSPLVKVNSLISNIKNGK
ncbi:MAG: GNAT family N-acetyltransferase [Bacteroidales bacterium]